MNIKIGVGKTDVTGPCARVGFMGYFDPKQTGRGMQTRLYSRAFVVEDLDNKKIAALVFADIHACYQALHEEVFELMEEDEYQELQNYYKKENVLIAGSHTHGAPGGFSHSIFYNLTIPGFSRQNFKRIAKGIIDSIKIAHNSRKEGKILVARGLVEDCNWNRSINAYNNNPAEERQQYEWPVDKEMTLLKFVADSGEVLGSVNWFPVHAVSMSIENELLTSDNKGFAEWVMEQRNEGIAAFTNSNGGDVSPNDPGSSNDCEQKTDFENMVESGKKQYETAQKLYNSAAEELSGSLDYRQTYVDISQVEIKGEKKSSTWKASYGLATVAGPPLDAPGVPIWPPGYNRTKFEHDPKFLRKLAGQFVDGFINQEIIIPEADREKYVAGQGQKPFLITPGYVEIFNNPLISQVVPLQLIKLGSLVLIAHPGEPTTMAGRRLRNTVLDILGDTGVKYAVVAAYAGSYTGYTATKEEYDTQYYEAASTLFGPHTLAAYRQENARLALDIKNQDPTPVGEEPPDMSANRVFLNLDIHLFDSLPGGADYGDVSIQPEESYLTGETVTAQFFGAYPNNDLKTGETYLGVEKLINGQWQEVYSDKDFCTAFAWQDKELSDEDITGLLNTMERDETFMASLKDLEEEVTGNVQVLEELKSNKQVGTMFKDNYNYYKELLDIIQPILNADSEDQKRELIEEFLKKTSFYSLIEITWTIPKQETPGTYRLVYYGDYKTLLIKTPFSGKSNEFKVKKSNLINCIISYLFNR